MSANKLIKDNFSYSFSVTSTVHYARHLASLFVMYLVFCRFEFFGIYVVMFKSILGTLLQVLIVFSILVFAFGVTFFAILRVEVGFSTIFKLIYTL